MILAGKAGATFVSPFIRRVGNDVGGMADLAEITTIFRNYPYFQILQVLVASVPTPRTWWRRPSWSAQDIATVPPAVLRLRRTTLLQKGSVCIATGPRRAGALPSR